MDQFIVLKSMPVGPAWEAFLLPVSGYPMPEQELRPIRTFLGSLSSMLAAERNLKTEVFIQFTQLHIGDGSARFSQHGREWMPALGLGVWPDREPPILWTKEYFQSLTGDDNPRPLMYQVYRLTAGSKDKARDTMLGLGTVLQIMTRDSADALLGRMSARLRAPIKHPSFTSFPFYVPLLEGKSVRGAADERLHAWCCGASVYLRESVEDRAILIATSEPVTPMLREWGAQFQDGPEHEWRIPCS